MSRQGGGIRKANMTTTIEIADLPTTQFTAGAIVKSGHARILEDAHAMLAPLVENGTLTKKVAGSGAIFYKLVKGAANAKKSGAARAASKKASKKASKTRTAGASTDRAERASLAIAERKAVKEWEKNGSKGRRPKTPNADAISNGDKPASKTTRKATGTSGPRGTTVRFVIDGKPMPDSQNKLSSVAWYHTKGVGGDDVARIDVKALKALLVEAGVPDPANTVGVNVTLPNGKVITTTAL